MLSLSGLASALWLAGWLPGLPLEQWQSVPRLSPWLVLLDLIGLVWVAAFVALVHGRSRAAQALAVLGLGPGAAVALADTISVGRPALISWLNLALNALVVLALTAYGQESRPVRRRPWLAALAIGAVTMTALWFIPMLVFGWQPALDWPGLVCVLFVATALAHLAGPLGRGAPERPSRPGLPGDIARAASARRRPSWSLALALLAAATLAFRLLTLLEYLVIAAPANRWPWIASAVVEAIAVAAVGVPLAAIAALALRRLPALDADST